MYSRKYDNLDGLDDSRSMSKEMGVTKTEQEASCSNSINGMWEGKKNAKNAQVDRLPPFGSMDGSTDTGG
jgi:hypothetical protein